MPTGLHHGEVSIAKIFLCDRITHGALKKTNACPHLSGMSDIARWKCHVVAATETASLRPGGDVAR